MSDGQTQPAGLQRFFDIDGKDQGVDALKIILMVIDDLPEEDRERVFKSAQAFLGFA